MLGMGMWNDRRLAGRLAARGCLLLLGFAGALWSADVLPVFRAMASAKEAEAKIVEDARFKRGALGEVLARLESYPKRTFELPELLRAKALVRLRVTEDTIERNGSGEVDGGVVAAGDGLRSAILMNPGDAFAWLMLYSVESFRAGFDLSSVRYLEHSYRIAPFEGWIALRRNRLTLAVFQLLTNVVQQGVISEFAALVDSGFVEDAATNFERAGATERDRLLRCLERVDMAQRQAFAKRLSFDGLKVSVPGVEVGDRPWR